MALGKDGTTEKKPAPESQAKFFRKILLSLASISILLAALIWKLMSVPDKWQDLSESTQALHRDIPNPWLFGMTLAISTLLAALFVFWIQPKLKAKIKARIKRRTKK